MLDQSFPMSLGAGGHGPRGGLKGQEGGCSRLEPLHLYQRGPVEEDRIADMTAWINRYQSAAARLSVQPELPNLTCSLTLKSLKTTPLETVLKDPGLREKFSRNSVSLVRENFTTAIMARRTLEYYRDLLSAR